MSERGPPDCALDNYPRNGAILRGEVIIVPAAGSWLHVHAIKQKDALDFTPTPGPECYIMLEMKHGPVLFPV